MLFVLFCDINKLLHVKLICAQKKEDGERERGREKDANDKGNKLFELFVNIKIGLKNDHTLKNNYAIIYVYYKI